MCLFKCFGTNERLEGIIGAIQFHEKKLLAEACPKTDIYARIERHNLRKIYDVLPWKRESAGISTLSWKYTTLGYGSFA